MRSLCALCLLIACDNPGALEGAPEVVKESDLVLKEACGALDYFGRCAGSTAEWCNSGLLNRHDCSPQGMGCGWASDSLGFWCVWLFGCRSHRDVGG